MAPVRPDEALHLAGDRQAVLRDDLRERERLPAVRIAHVRAGLCDDERRVDRLVVRVDVPRLLQRAVVAAALDDRRRDAVAERRRRVALGADVVDVVTEALHRGGELGERLLETGGDRVAVEEQPVRRVADRRLAGRLHVVGVVLLVDEVAVRAGLVGRPGVPHRRRDVEEVARVHGRSRHVAADRVQQRFVPHARDRPRVGPIALAAR